MAVKTYTVRLHARTHVRNEYGLLTAPSPNHSFTVTNSSTDAGSVKAIAVDGRNIWLVAVSSPRRRSEAFQCRTTPLNGYVVNSFVLPNPFWGTGVDCWGLVYNKYSTAGARFYALVNSAVTCGIYEFDIGFRPTRTIKTGLVNNSRGLAFDGKVLYQSYTSGFQAKVNEIDPVTGNIINNYNVGGGASFVAGALGSGAVSDGFKILYRGDTENLIVGANPYYPCSTRDGYGGTNGSVPGDAGWTNPAPNAVPGTIINDFDYDGRNFYYVETE